MAVKSAAKGSERLKARFALSGRVGTATSASLAERGGDAPHYVEKLARRRGTGRMAQALQR